MEKRIPTLLAKIAPGSQLLTIRTLPGNYSNDTCLVEAQGPDRALLRFVVRRYAVFSHYDRGEKAQREFRVYELLRRNEIPAPEPLYLDTSGAILGSPGIVTSYVRGSQVVSPSKPDLWARSLARTLAKIHTVTCDDETRRFLLDANAEATWFLRSDRLPYYMQAHPDGPAVWQMLHNLHARLQPVPGGLVHVDYWSGNTLWYQGQISAVVDWEEAAYGDPGIDVAYCRMDMVLLGMAEAADIFLDAYETATGHRVANLRFWELAAAVRPMFSPKGWISASPAKERFHTFIGLDS